MCIIEIMIYVRTAIIVLVAVNKLMGETVVTSPLGSRRPSTIHHSDVEGPNSLLASSIPRGRTSNIDGTFSLSIDAGLVKLRRPNENGESVQCM